MAKQRRMAPLILLLLLVFVGGIAYRWGTGRLDPVAPGATEPVLVEIPTGLSTREVAELLEQRQVIKDAVFFRYYARYRKLDVKIQGGEYELTRGMSPDQILQKLSRGEVVVRRFTVPEGLTVAQLADLLAGKKLVERDKFLQLAAASQLNAAYLPKDVKLAQPLEGYLFPSTYDYKPGVSEEQILSMMYAGWEKAFAADLKARAKETGLTVHEVMTLASIIETEAQVAQERPVIGGVYLNRLRIGMKLDADPTVRYAVGRPAEQELRAADLEVESPYNTYRRAGLPPGPIAAPGLASIRAALYPAKHDFWFFVAKADGTGQHYFAETLGEQTDNIEKARANAKK
ncbi:MAG TPA: endolytic transglycosylase MltG [Symbiobacteriaceae bacterium]|nr:endolytic transglycosylase MltG [Symbiobacteriaceae bacterium]